MPLPPILAGDILGVVAIFWEGMFHFNSNEKLSVYVWTLWKQQKDLKMKSNILMMLHLNIVWSKNLIFFLSLILPGWLIFLFEYKILENTNHSCPTFFYKFNLMQWIFEHKLQGKNQLFHHKLEYFQLSLLKTTFVFLLGHSLFDKFDNFCNQEKQNSLNGEIISDSNSFVEIYWMRWEMAKFKI
jgi:hypothetical protein